MKVIDLFKIVIDTQKITVVDKKDVTEVLYQGIKAGCGKEYNDSDVYRIQTDEQGLLIKIDYQPPKFMTASNEELLSMYFDESELGLNLDDLEQNLAKLTQELDDIKFDF